MFQDGPFVNRAIGGAQPGPLFRLPGQVTALGAVDEGVLEIDLWSQQEGQIAGLVNVEAGRQVGPGPVVHPDAGDVVAVGLEFAGARADDGRIAAIYADAGIVARQELAHLVRFQQQEREAILPEIAPAAPAAPVIVVGQEGVAKEPPQHWLDGHPFQPAVVARVGGLKGKPVAQRLPVRPRRSEVGGKAVGAAVGGDQRRALFFLRDDRQHQHVGAGLPRL